MAHATHTMSREMQQCIDECHACHSVCLQTARHCLEKSGRHADAHHVTLLLDCAEICETSAGFLSRMSDHHSSVCRTCAEICRACEESCRRLGDDETMRECAEACRRCAESCERMATAA